MMISLWRGVWHITHPTGKSRPEKAHETILESNNLKEIVSTYLDRVPSFQYKLCQAVAVDTVRGWFVVLRSPEFGLLPNGRREWVAAARLDEVNAIKLAKKLNHAMDKE